MSKTAKAGKTSFYYGNQLVKVTQIKLHDGNIKCFAKQILTGKFSVQLTMKNLEYIKVEIMII